MSGALVREFGSAPAASALQLAMLAGILLAQSIAVALVLELVVRGRLRRRAGVGAGRRPGLPT